MKRIYFLLGIACLILTTHSFSQRHYRVRKFDSQLYVLPPGKNLRFDKNEIREQYSFFYLRLRNIGKKYSDAKRGIENIHTTRGGIDYFDVNVSKKIPGATLDTNKRDCNCALSQNTFSSWAFMSNNNEYLFMQINFAKLTRNNVINNFNTLIHELLTSLTPLEAPDYCHCAPGLELPTGFTQLLLKKLKEQIPFPANMPQPGTHHIYTKNNSYFMLLDEEYQLKVDIVDKNDLTVGGHKKFEYSSMGTQLYSFNRSEEGEIIQNGSALFNNGLPNNYIGNRTYKIASLADIQFSSELKDIYYIAFYHPPLKRNNNLHELSSTGGYSVSDDNQPHVGNALLLHLRSSQLANLDLADIDPYTKSIFGDRNSIAPTMKVYINGIEKSQSVTTMPSDISCLPDHFGFYRKYRNNYRKVKGFKKSVYLLPNDHLNYRL